MTHYYYYKMLLSSTLDFTGKHKDIRELEGCRILNPTLFWFHTVATTYLHQCIPKKQSIFKSCSLARWLPPKVQRGDLWATEQNLCMVTWAATTSYPYHRDQNRFVIEMTGGNGLPWAVLKPLYVLHIFQLNSSEYPANYPVPFILSRTEVFPCTKTIIFGFGGQ